MLNRGEFAFLFFKMPTGRRVPVRGARGDGLADVRGDVANEDRDDPIDVDPVEARDEENEPAEPADVDEPAVDDAAAAEPAAADRASAQRPTAAASRGGQRPPPARRRSRANGGRRQLRLTVNDDPPIQPNRPPRVLPPLETKLMTKKENCGSYRKNDASEKKLEKYGAMRCL